MTTRKLKLVLEITVPEGVTDARMKKVIDNALGEAAIEARMEKWKHANFEHKVKTWKPDPLLATQTQTIKEQEEALFACSAKLEQVTDALMELRNQPMQATTVNTIQTVNAIIEGINKQELTIPPSSYSKTEHFKAGCREALRVTNLTVREVGVRLVRETPQASDAELFAYWIQEAAIHPMRVMKALSGVDTIEGYRTAINAMREEDKFNLSQGTGNQINEQGTLQ